MVRTILNILTLTLMVSLLCLSGAGKSFAWFHHPAGKEGVPEFERAGNEDGLSGSYLVIPNKGKTGGGLQGDSLYGGATRGTAGALDVDIEFNLLKNTVVNTKTLLDRQIAANLKVKNILEEYLAAKKRNAQLLKDLSIPYLDGKTGIKTKIYPQVSEMVEPAHKIKKKLVDFILFQKRVNEVLPIQNSADFQAAWYGSKKVDTDALPNGGALASASGTGYIQKAPGTGRYAGMSGNDTQLPWILTFGLKLLRFVLENSIAILVWSAAMALAGLIGMLVVTR